MTVYKYFIPPPCPNCGGLLEWWLKKQGWVLECLECNSQYYQEIYGDGHLENIQPELSLTKK